MADHNIEPLDIQLSPAATVMLRRHLLKCAEAGLPVTADSLCEEAIAEWMRVDDTPAGVGLRRRFKRHFDSEFIAHVESGDIEIAEDDEAFNRFLFDQTGSYAVIHYLSHVIKGGNPNG